MDVGTLVFIAWLALGFVLWGPAARYLVKQLRGRVDNEDLAVCVLGGFVAAMLWPLAISAWFVFTVLEYERDEKRGRVSR